MFGGGLRHDHEPNAYGLKIAALIDAYGLGWDDLHDPAGDRHSDDPCPRKRGKASDRISPAG
jgi:hypothetical protein